MRIDSSDICTETRTDMDELVFSVDDEDHGFIFEMLRSKIYTDNISAICREISANARDANREAGNADKPVRIGIERRDGFDDGSSMLVYFEDDGPGISPDRMRNIFCKYAKSTKRDTDEQTGGFGLGAKTPFSYADSFFIITRVDGVKYCYSAYIDESRRGKICELSREATAESNGTRISVPIMREDEKKFAHSICRCTAMWDVPPTLHNVTESYSVSVLADYGVAPSGNRLLLVRASDTRVFRGIMFVVDGMRYDVSAESLADCGICIELSHCDNASLAICVGNDAVDLATNRESLSYTTRTCNFIYDAINEAASVIYDALQKAIDAAGTQVEAACMLEAHVRNRMQMPYCIANLASKEYVYRGRTLRLPGEIKHVIFKEYVDGTYLNDIFGFSMSKFVERGAVAVAYSRGVAHVPHARAGRQFVMLHARLPKADAEMRKKMKVAREEQIMAFVNCLRELGIDAYEAKRSRGGSALSAKTAVIKYDVIKYCGRKLRVEHRELSQDEPTAYLKCDMSGARFAKQFGERLFIARVMFPGKTIVVADDKRASILKSAGAECAEVDANSAELINVKHAALEATSYVYWTLVLKLFHEELATEIAERETMRAMFEKTPMPRRAYCDADRAVMQTFPKTYAMRDLIKKKYPMLHIIFKNCAYSVYNDKCAIDAMREYIKLMDATCENATAI